MNKISFRCGCGAQFISASHVYKISEKQLHKNGWKSVTESNGHVKRVCPDCLKQI